MTASSAITSGVGKSLAVHDGERFPQIGETNRRVINAIKQLYDAPAVIFGRWLGITDKTAKRKLNFERTLSAEELGTLIRSERGFEIVDAIMGDARPEWWRLCSLLMEAADIKKMQLAAQRRIAKTIAGALDADKSLSEAIARADALAFHGQDQAGVLADALRATNGVPDRPMAPPKKR